VQRYQSYKFELRPDSGQPRQMRRIAGCCRFVFNQALAIQLQRREQGQPGLVLAQLNLQLAEWRRRPESTWMADVPFGCLQQALRNLERAFARYNDRQAQFPRFERRGLSDSFRYSRPSELKLDQANGRILLPRLGWLRYRRFLIRGGSSSDGSWNTGCAGTVDASLPYRHGKTFDLR
jgi:putative transposase